jgi:hypothetical protein
MFKILEDGLSQVAAQRTGGVGVHFDAQRISIRDFDAASEARLGGAGPSAPTDRRDAAEEPDNGLSLSATVLRALGCALRAWPGKVDQNQPQSQRARPAMR